MTATLSICTAVLPNSAKLRCPQSAPAASDSVYHQRVKRLTTNSFIAFTGIACAALVIFLLVDLPLFAAVTKLLASSGFLATAWSAGAHRHRYGKILSTGLVLSWIGDAFLISTAQQIFLLGLVSFLFAHVAYIIAFTDYGLNRKWMMFASVPVVVAAMLVLTWLTPQVSADMDVPVRAYTVVISIMVVTAFGSKGEGASILVVIGALLFFISDLSVAALRFTATEFPTYIWGLPFYYAGQLCLALSAAEPLRIGRSYPARGNTS